MANTKPERNSLTLFVAATLAAVIFGDYSHDIAKWIVCIHSDKIVGSVCSDAPVSEALMIGTLLSTFVAVFAAGYAGQWGDEKPTKATLLIVGAFAGSFLALLKAAEGDLGYPQFDRLKSALLVYAISVFIMSSVYFARFSWKQSTANSFALAQRIAIAVFVGAALGAAVQSLAEVVWQGNIDRYSSRKFVIAPSAIVIGGGVFSTILLDSWFRFGAARPKWLTLWLTAAVVISGAYVVLIYLPTHRTGWIANSGALGIGHIVIVLLVLLLCGIIASALAAIAGPASSVKNRLIWTVPPAALISAAAGYEVGRLRLNTGAIVENDVWTLAIVHACSCGFVIVTALLVDLIHRRIPRGQKV